MTHNIANDLSAITSAILAAIDAGDIPKESQLSAEARIADTRAFVESNAACAMHYAGKRMAIPYAHRLLILAYLHGVDLGEPGQRVGVAVVKGWDCVYLQ